MLPVFLWMVIVGFLAEVEDLVDVEDDVEDDVEEIADVGSSSKYVLIPWTYLKNTAGISSGIAAIGRDPPHAAPP